jgi:hypothetical protein
MKTKSIFTAFAFAMAAVIFTQCDDDDVPALEYKQQGVIKGTITGTTEMDNISINESFSYSQYQAALSNIEDGTSYYEVDDDGEIDIYVIRQNFETGAYFYLAFSLDNANDTTPSKYCEMSYRDDDFNGKSFVFYMGSSGNNFTISDFSFEQASGRLKGKYVLEGDENSTGKNATVTGEFDIVVKQLIR